MGWEGTTPSVFTRMKFDLGRADGQGLLSQLPSNLSDAIFLFM